MSRLVASLRYVFTFTALILLLAAFGARPALAAGVVGNGTPGSCTETALTTALNGGGAVTFNCGANPATITLNTVHNITADTSLDGGSKITLKAKNINHFQVQNSYTVTIKNITLTGGKSGSAGSIENFGVLKVINVVFKGNKADGGSGGAIHNYNILNVNNSRFENNAATGAGGAIADEGTKATIKKSQFLGNKGAQGGAVYSDGTLVVKKSIFSSNNQGSDGGAILVDLGGTAKITGTTIDGNSSATNAGGVSNYGTTTITTSTIKNNTAGNVGGGITNAGALTLQTSTLSGNKSVAGGGLYDFGSSDAISRSTISGNESTGDGGGVYTIINTSISNSTISGNKTGTSNGGGGWFQYGGASSMTFVTIANNIAAFGGGIYADGSKTSEIDLQQSVLSNNTGFNCDGLAIVSLGHNLSSDKYCKSVFVNTGDQNKKNARLGPLANNGGPTLTHLPLAGSPLINTGGTAGILFDQRGSSRPFGVQADIGSVEVH